VAQSFALGSALVLSLSVLLAVPAAAQTYRADRPYRGLFGSGVSRDTQQSLIASVSLGAGWDNDLIADAAGAQSSAGVGRFKGGLGTTAGAIAYALSRDRYSLGASYNTSLNYYPDLRDRFVRRDYFSGTASTRLTRDLSAHAGVGYRPYTTSTFYPLLFTPRPGDPTVEDDDLITKPEHYEAGTLLFVFRRRRVCTRRVGAGNVHGELRLSRPDVIGVGRPIRWSHCRRALLPHARSRVGGACRIRIQHWKVH
jgi:hypothetical protein